LARPGLVSRRRECAPRGLPCQLIDAGPVGAGSENRPSVNREAANTAYRLRVEIEAIQKRRPKQGTGIYDRATGNLDEAKLAEYLREFDKNAVGGKLRHDQLAKMLEKRGPLGRVSRGQFRSLVQLTTKLNGSPTVTRDQLIGLYDGSLLYLARAKASAMK